MIWPHGMTWSGLSILDAVKVDQASSTVLKATVVYFIMHAVLINWSVHALISLSAHALIL